MSFSIVFILPVAVLALAGCASRRAAAPPPLPPGLTRPARDAGAAARMVELHVDALPSTERIRVARDMGYFPRSVVTRSGAIVIVFRAGAGHVGAGGALMATRSGDAGRTWSAPVVAIDEPDCDDRNPALGVAADGTLVLAYWANRRHRPGARTGAGFVYSRDDGRSWSKPVVAPAGAPWSGFSPFGRMLTLPGGRMALPLYLRNRTWLVRSDDQGRTWGDPTLVAEDMNETAYAVLPSGEWVLVGREANGHGNFSLVRWSADEGRTWSPPVPFLVNRRLPSDLAILSDGSLFAVHGYRTIPRGVRAVRSIDGGRTWSRTDLIVHDKAERNTDCGYPSVEVLDGWVVISFYDASNAPDDKSDPTGAFLEVVRIRESEILKHVR